MLQEVFYWIFNMSITAALTGLLIMLVRLIKRIPRRLTTFLWIIPFLRMTIPLGLDSPYSLMSLLSKITTKTVVVFQPTEDVSFSMMNSVMAANSYFPITYKVNILENILSVASVIWAVVALASILMLNPETVFHTKELSLEVQDDEVIFLEMSPVGLGGIF